MIARPFFFGSAFIVAMLTGAACSSSSSSDPPAAADAGPATPTDATAGDASDAATSETGEGALPADITVLASGLSDLAGVTATESTVYFLERLKGIVHAVPLAGGAVTDVATTGASPSSIAVVGSDLFWADHDQLTLSRAPIAGGSVSTMVVSPGQAPVAMAAGSDRVVLAAVGAGDVGEIRQVQYSGDFVFGPVIGQQENPGGVAVSEGDIVWTESNAGKVWKTQAGTGNAPSAVATGETDCRAIAADGSGVYWSRPAQGLVRGAVGSKAVATIASNQQSPSSLAADASGVYWLTADGKLVRWSHSELPASSVTKGFKSGFATPYVQGIALTSQYVVWITTDGKVLRHDK